MAHKTPSGRSSQAWKDFERAIAELFRKVGFTQAHRISRGDDIGQSDTDVRVPEVPFIQVDCKYKQAGWAHETIFEECEKKYCPKGSKNFLVLPTKSGKKQGSLSTVRSEVLAELLAYRYLGGKKDQPLSCPQCTGPVTVAVSALNLATCTCTNCDKQFLLSLDEVPKALLPAPEAA